MNYIHYNVDVKTNDTVEVTLDKQAYVRLLDDINYSKYKRGEKHSSHGDLARTSPVILQAPRPGHWHLIIDLGGSLGTVKASVRII